MLSRKTRGRASDDTAGAGRAEFSPPPQPRVAEPGAGPVALKRIGIDQHNLKLSLRFTVANPLPPMHDLKRFPSAIGSDERHMCVAADGTAIERRLICVGGPVEQPPDRARHLPLRQGRQGEQGARADRRSSSGSRRTRSGSSSRSATPASTTGASATSAPPAWMGTGCGRRGRQGAKREGRAGVVCHSRAPETGRTKGRIFKVVRAGCTPGKHGIVTNGPRDEKKIALTFDDGPERLHEPDPAALDHAHAKGTFFEVGSLVRGADRTWLLPKIVAHGHEVGNHSWAHETLPSGSSMSATISAIRNATGFTPCHFRPPGGAYNSGTIHAAAAERDVGRQLGRRHPRLDRAQLGVDHLERDIRRSRARSCSCTTAAATARQTGGGACRTSSASSKNRGYKLVTVTELLGGHFKLREKH